MRRSASSLAFVVAALTVAALAAPPSTVAAQDEDAAEARSLFEQGVEASREDRWADAVDLFRRSRAILERPSAVFNTAVALHRMGRVLDALADTEAYLAMTTADARGERARYAQAEQLREELQGQVAVLTIAVAPPDARVEVDGRRREEEGAEREIRLDPGPHAVRVSAEGHTSARLEVRLGRGQAERREVTLEPSEEGAEPEPEPEPEPLPAAEGGGLGGLGVAGLAIAAVGAGAGIGALVTGLISQDTYDSLLARCPGGVCPAGSEGDLSSGEALAWTSTILLGVSIVGLGVGLALLIVDLVSGDAPDERAALRVVPADGGAALRLRF